MNELALCAGIGGISLGLKRAGFRTVCYVENAPYPVSVLKARIRDGQLDDAPIWDDVTTFDGTPWHGCVDIVTAGFPCQPFSLAGTRQGVNDKRYLWPSVFRTICATLPRYVLLENVSGLLSMDEGQVAGGILADLASWLSDCGGGQIECLCLQASDVGAPHKRERVCIMAYTNGMSKSKQEQSTQAERVEGDTWMGLGSAVADSLSPTPVRNWFIPTADALHSRPLQNSVERSRGSGQLSPMWVEWLMGFPIGWSDLQPLATP